MRLYQKSNSLFVFALPIEADGLKKILSDQNHQFFRGSDLN